MLIDLLNSCLQSFYKISNLNISTWIVLLIPFFLGGLWFIHLLHVEKKYKKNDVYIPNENACADENVLDKYIGKIHDTKSKVFKYDYYYWTNELLVTIGSGIFILLNLELDSNWFITSWQDSKLHIIFTTIIMLFISKIIIQGFIVSDIVDTFVLVSQLLISILITKRLPLFIFWYTYPVGLIASFVMFRKYKKLKKNPFEKFTPGRYKILTPEEEELQRELKRQQEEMSRSSYSYRPNYSRPHKSEKESLYEMKHPSASSTQMSNMLKFGENRPNG